MESEKQAALVIKRPLSESEVGLSNYMRGLIQDISEFDVSKKYRLNGSEVDLANLYTNLLNIEDTISLSTCITSEGSVTCLSELETNNRARKHAAETDRIDLVLAGIIARAGRATEVILGDTDTRPFDLDQGKVSEEYDFIKKEMRRVMQTQEDKLTSEDFPLVIMLACHKKLQEAKGISSR